MKVYEKLLHIKSVQALFLLVIYIEVLFTLENVKGK